MDKYAVEQRKKMQQDALDKVQEKLRCLMSHHAKTASADDEERTELQRLQQQERELREALADQNDG